MNNTEIVQDGKIWHLWSAIYLHNGSTYSMNFYAENIADAKDRIQSMRDTLSDGHQILDVINVEDVDDNFNPDKYMDGLVEDEN